VGFFFRNEGYSVALLCIPLAVVVCLCLFMLMGCTGRHWFCCLFSLSLVAVGRIGGCGLRETHAGLLQSVSDSPSTFSNFGLCLLHVLLSLGCGCWCVRCGVLLFCVCCVRGCGMRLVCGDCEAMFLFCLGGAVPYFIV